MLCDFCHECLTTVYQFSDDERSLLLCRRCCLEIRSARVARRKAAREAEEQAIPEEYRARLIFVRWLIETGRLSDECPEYQAAEV